MKAAKKKKKRKISVLKRASKRQRLKVKAKRRKDEKKYHAPQSVNEERDMRLYEANWSKEAFPMCCMTIS